MKGKGLFTQERQEVSRRGKSAEGSPAERWSEQGCVKKKKKDFEQSRRKRNGGKNYRIAKCEKRKEKT